MIDADPTAGNIIEFGIFGAGRGGDTFAQAAVGRMATAQQPAGAGGAAMAMAGRGGTVYPSIISMGNALPEGAYWSFGQIAGSGGTATAIGGDGGSGSSEFPDGGPGGAGRAEGGDGGDAMGANAGPTGGPGPGLGGVSSLYGGNGGAGFDRCGSAGPSGAERRVLFAIGASELSSR